MHTSEAIIIALIGGDLCSFKATNACSFTLFIQSLKSWSQSSYYVFYLIQTNLSQYFSRLYVFVYYNKYVVMSCKLNRHYIP